MSRSVRLFALSEIISFYRLRLQLGLLQGRTGTGFDTGLGQVFELSQLRAHNWDVFEFNVYFGLSLGPDRAWVQVQNQDCFNSELGLFQFRTETASI